MADEANQEVVDETTSEEKVADKATENTEVENASENQEDKESESDNSDIESLLKALENDDDSTAEGNESEKKDDESKPFKTVGDHVFKTEADYDAWALKSSGDARRLQGELKKALSNQKVAPTKQTAIDINDIRTQIKVADFFEENPKADENREVIAALLRSGKCNTLKEAAEKASILSDDGGEESETKDGVKKILKAGGSDSGTSTNSYKSSEEVDNLSSFADSILSGKI